MSNVKGPKKQLGKSCGKLKRKHPQGIQRIKNLHPQSLERMSAEQEEAQETE